MAEKINREFSWLDVIDEMEKVTKDDSFSPGAITKKTYITDKKEGHGIHVPLANAIYTLSSNIGHIADEGLLTQEEKEQSERLGEEIEKDFGNLEPSEPFGPIDPEDPIQGQPMPQDSRVHLMEEFDPYSIIEEDEPQAEEEKVFYITKEEYENLATKREIKILTKAVKKLRNNLEVTSRGDRKRSRNMLLWSIFISIFLISASFLAIYYVIPKWFPESGIISPVPQTELTPAVDEYAPATVSGVSLKIQPEVKTI